MKVTATQTVEVELSKEELGRALRRWAREEYGRDDFDDVGCDWLTDDAGSTYVGGADWHVSTNPEFATLIDAANLVQYGHRLIVEPLVQPSMFESGEDTPLFTLPEDAPAEPAIELMYSELSPRAVDVALACIDYAWPKNTVGGCWAHLNKLTASGDISEELSNEIRMNADFLFL